MAAPRRALGDMPRQFKAFMADAARKRARVGQQSGAKVD
ncbi:hypothetical protein L493_1950 [Bordetella bronchiseptica 99-R-0433]|nr:hypothetical protein L493_1950 [Bordetella bronchiseptica 99-R-0433]KDD23313.1 hypothetical protein L525_2003 [Bordetella bronchiseptica MBORD782]SHS12574.1 Uncharacterised protein [Mycobacteroides abscessus subsp. abscessus]